MKMRIQNIIHLEIKKLNIDIFIFFVIVIVIEILFILLY